MYPSTSPVQEKRLSMSLPVLLAHQIFCLLAYAHLPHRKESPPLI